MDLKNKNPNVVRVLISKQDLTPTSDSIVTEQLQNARLVGSHTCIVHCPPPADKIEPGKFKVQEGA